MRRVNNDDTFQNIMKVGKRIAITVLVTAVFLIIIAYLLRNVIKSNGLQILLFMVVFGVVVLIEEIIARKREKRKTEVMEDRDVFK